MMILLKAFALGIKICDYGPASQIYIQALAFRQHFATAEKPKLNLVRVAKVN